MCVIDMQNDFVKRGGSLVVPDAEATIPAIEELLDTGPGQPYARGLRAGHPPTG